MPNIDQMAEQIVGAMRGYVAQAIGGIGKRLDALELRLAQPIVGPAGRDGKDGAPGANGIDGKDGSDGVDGKDGAPGRDGKDGAPGRDGIDGEDVDPTVLLTLQNMLEKCQRELEATKEMLAKMTAAPASFLIDASGVLVAVYPDGETKAIGQVRGKDGEAGAAVMDGAVNGDGALILRMSDGRILNAGTVRGAAGRDGKDGATGPRGRDAHELPILPGLDESRSYAEGVCALYRGGLVRAERQTDPIDGVDIARAGWRALLEGIGDESEQMLEDERLLERTTVYTSGRVFTRSYKLATPLFRGVWREGAYARGDMAQRAGSVWYALRDTTETPTPGAADWVLATKKGADGKDGAPGKPGERGAEGRAGRDLTQMGFDGRKY